MEDDKRGLLRGLSIFFIVVTVVAISLRFMSRKLSRLGLLWDDWLSLAAVPLAIAINMIHIIAANRGMGQHVNDAPTDALANYMKLLHAEQILFVIVLTLIKLSVVFFFKRVFENITPAFNAALCVTGIVTVVWLVANLLLSFFQCFTAEAGNCLNSTTFNERSFIIGQGTTNVAIDFVILFLPLPLVVRMRVGHQQKLALCFAFFLGYFVPILAVMRLITAISAIDVVFKTQDSTTPPDLTYLLADPMIWSSAETSLGILSTCVPAMQHLWRQVLKRALVSIFKNSNNAPDRSKRPRRMYGVGQREEESGTSFECLDTTGSGSRIARYHAAILETIRPGLEHAAGVESNLGPEDNDRAQLSIQHEVADNLR